MLDIVLVDPPAVLKERFAKIASGNETPPHSLLFLGAVLRENNYKCKIIDTNVLKLDIETSVNKILETSPKFVGITAPSMSMPGAIKIAKLLKKKAPNIVIILGGPHITAVPQETMTKYPDFDIGVIGEGEITIIELLKALEGKGILNSVKGIIYRENGSLILNERRPFIVNLDSLPFPAWDMLPNIMEDYEQSAVRVYSLPSFSLCTSRGCPFKCIFCDRAIFGNTVRGYSADYVINMILYLKDKYKIKDITFEDDNFVALRKRLIEICNWLISEKVNITWDCSTNINTVDKEILTLMKRAGCWQINFGIESGSQRILDFIKKGIKIEKVEQVLKMTRDAGIVTKGYFMIGHPTETRETIQETIDFIKKISLDIFQISYVVPFPGSELYSIADKYGEFGKDLDGMNIWTPLFVPHGLTKEELERMSMKAFREFYFKQPQHILKFLKRATRPSVFKKFIKEGFKIFKFVLTERK